MHSRKQKVHSLITTAQIAAPSFDESRMFDPNDPTISDSKLNSVNDFEMSVGLWIV